MSVWTLWKRWFGEARLLLLACCLGLFAFGWLRIWLVGQLPTRSLEIILEQVWDKYERFSPVSLGQLLTYHGRIALAFQEPIVFFCIAIWAIARGSDTVAGHLNRGVLEMLLAQPVSRRSLYATQAALTLSGLLLVSTCLWLGVAAGIRTTRVHEEHSSELRVPGLGLQIPLPFGPTETRRVPLAQKTSPAYFVHPVANAFCLGVFLAGLATMLSAWENYRWRTIGVVATFVIVQMIMRILCVWSPKLHWLAYFTIFSAYEPEVIVSVVVNASEDIWKLVQVDEQGRWLRPGPLGYHLLLLVPGLAFFGVGSIIFARRDLPAPI